MDGLMKHSAFHIPHSAFLTVLLLLLPDPSRAQTDPRGHWRTWHTAHFRIHARAEHAAVAGVAAREAERAYEALARELVPPRTTVDLVLYDNVDFANGFTPSGSAFA